MSDSPADELEFAKLVAGDSTVDLAEVLFDLASDAYPALDRSAGRAELDRLGALARARVAAIEPGPQPLRRRLLELSRLLYVDEGFRGNEREYYDPRNSYLNEVLTRRLGIPITLGVVYLAVAERAGVSMHGVPTPGHFVLGARAGGENWFVDPFTSGDVLPLEACRHRIERMTGQEGVLTPEHFRPATPAEIASRVLRNLKSAYVMVDRWTEALPVQERLVRLLPDAPDEKRDLGLLYLRLGRPVPALALLEPYAQQCTAEQAEQLAPYLRSARRMRAELN